MDYVDLVNPPKPPRTKRRPQLSIDLGKRSMNATVMKSSILTSDLKKQSIDSFAGKKHSIDS